MNHNQTESHKMTKIRLGILAFQGAFDEHKYSLERALDSARERHGSVTLETVTVRRAQDFCGLDGLILPGGESTTMSKFLAKNNFYESLIKWMEGEEGVQPVVWGTCAGLILLANTITDMKTGGQLSIGGLDVTVSRNAYGRQNESFESRVSLIAKELIRGEDKNKEYRGIFIRAPGILSIDSDRVSVLAELEHPVGVIRPVAVSQGRLLATAFHPELTEDFRWHQYFINMVLQTSR